MAGGRGREWAKRLGLLVASLLVCVVAVELVVMLWLGDRAPNLSLYVRDFEIGKRLRPGFVGEEYGAEVRINAHGMRDRALDPAKRPGTTRVLVLGDSWTFGAGVGQSETWPRRLEVHLREGGDAVDVMNTGVAGYETHHEAVYYEELAGTFEHDAVLVGLYPVNDVHDKRDRYALYRTLHEISPWLLWLYEAPSELTVTQLYENWRKARKHSRRREHYDEATRTDAGSAESASPGFAPGEDDWTLLYDPSFSGWIAMREALASIGATAREAGVPGAVVLFPDLRDLARYRDYCHPRVEPMIRAAVEGAGLELIDLVDDFSAYIGREPEVSGFVGSTHPNAAGDDLIARAVAREVETRGLVPALR